jgi:hypothetical protein
MNSNIFWTALLGTSLPSILVAAVVLYLTHRTNRRLEIIRAELQTKTKVSALQHEQEIAALVNLHESFRKYLDFVRRKFYVKSAPSSVDPMWDFFDSIEKELVYLNPKNRRLIKQYQGELVVFWNWAQSQPQPESVGDETELQRRLDYEIPGYLEKVREMIDTLTNRGNAQQD